MKATDFDLSRDLRFDPGTGITAFKSSRLILFDADAIGLLRQQIVEAMGVEKARELFLQFGYQHGYADHMQMRMNYTFDSEMDLLASGPVIHSWEGIVQATPREIRFDRETGDFYFTGVWTNSYEAQQHLGFHDVSPTPVCWSLMGYASGWCTAFFGRPLLAIEPVCVGMGHTRCEWLIKPPHEFGDEAAPYVKALNCFQGGL
jgi:hypothetical protein